MKIQEYTLTEARKIGDHLSVDWDKVDIHEFQKGINIEREHGLVNDITNITNDNDLVTGKLALAHLNENPDYYTRLEKAEEQPRLDPEIKFHYYGDLVRKVFFVAAAVMLIGLPFVNVGFTVPVLLSIVAIVFLDLLAGLTNPKQLWVNWANTVIASVSLIVFEYFAVRSLADSRAFLFALNQILAVLFLIAIYFNTKTLRNMILR